MVLSQKIQTEIEINEALAELFEQQKVNMQGASAAIAVIAQAHYPHVEKAKRLAQVERAIVADQAWFRNSLEALAKRYGLERVGCVMRAGIDLSEHTTH